MDLASGELDVLREETSVIGFGGGQVETNLIHFVSKARAQTLM